MAGHRKASGKPRKDVVSQQRAQARIAAAATPADRLTAAFDMFRQTVARAGRSGKPTDAAMDEATACLVRLAGDLSTAPARLHVVTAAGGSAAGSAV